MQWLALLVLPVSNSSLIRLFQVRNGCKTTVTMCRRPWRASAVRNIEKDFKELMHETTYESLVESSWLWWGIDMTGHVFY
jgi:hypothetical protein